MTEEVDIVIIGGGMAGLSLVRELITKKLHETYNIVILESRLGYQKDKIWSFWNVDDEDYSDIILNQWEEFRIIHEEPLYLTSKYIYQSVDSGDFYTKILSMIQTEPNIRLLTSREIHDITRDGEKRVIHTQIDEFKARYIFDSRPPQYDLGKEGLYQHFRGWHIKTGEPLFDTTAAVLMDFTCDQSNGLHFHYLLPYNEKEALIEATWFAPTILSDHDYNLDLDLYITDKYGMLDYEIVYIETGIIPMVMTIDGQSDDNQIINIGSRGGHTRPSTGYTFLTEQTFARKMAENLSRDKFVPPQIRSRWTLFLDKVFLRVLRDDPQLGPDIFFTLFARNPEDRVIRFLSERSSIVEELKIMVSVPYKIKFFRAVLLSLSPF